MLREYMPKDPEIEIRRQVGARLRVTRYAIWGKRKRKPCLEEMGISKNQLHSWEDGSAEPKVTYIVDLYEKKGVTPNWIYLGDPARMPFEIMEKINQMRGKS